MGKKKVKKPEQTIGDLAIIKQNFSKQEILKRIHKRDPGSRSRFSLEQKILILKLLQLNEMNYRMTGKEANVSRKSIFDWFQLYSEAILATTEPEFFIAENIQSDINTLHSELVVNAYRTANECIIKMGKLVRQATSVRQIYAIAEAVKTSAEIIRLDRHSGINPDEADFAMGIIDLVNKSKEKHGNKD